MLVGLDLARLAPPVQKALSPDAPAPLRTMAARGVFPGVKPPDVISAVAALSRDDDEALAAIAKATLLKLPPAILQGALAEELQSPVLDVLASVLGDQPAIVEQLLRQPGLTGDALERLAERASELIGELIATNEQKMLQFPVVIEKLYMNPAVRMSTSTRLVELAVRNDIKLAIPAFEEAAQAVLEELIPEPSEEPTYDDVLFRETVELSRSLTDPTAPVEETHELNEEGEELLRAKFVPLHIKIGQASIAQKIRMAMLATSSAELQLLARDSNRLVANSAVKSPKLKEPDAVLLSASRSVHEDVLRHLAMSRDFSRNYQVKYNLVTNPRTPFTFASRLIPLLRDSDLRMLGRSKNVPSSVGQAVRQQLSRKRPGS